MNEIDKNLLKEISEETSKAPDAYNIRKNGKSIDRKTNPFIDIVPKEDNKGIDVYVKENTLLGIVHIPVILTESGLKDVVYNDFHIGKNSNVIILAGCGVHNDEHDDTEHDGIHRFYLERYLKYFPYQKIENEHHENYHVLKKNSRHFFYSEGKYKNEHEILAKLFDFPFNI